MLTPLERKDVMGFPARYDGTCLRCGKHVKQGTYVTWSRRPGHKGIYHVDCDNPDFRPEGIEDKAPADYEPIPVDTETDHTEGDKPMTTPNGAMDPAQALQVLLASIQQKPAPTVDLAEVKRIAEQAAKEVFTKDGAVKLEIHKYDCPKITIDLAHRKLPLLVYYLSQRQHVYSYGPHGSGKSTGAQQAAEALGLRYGYISLTPQTPESRLLGYQTATGSYVRTPFRDCYELGGVFCIDETDNGSPSLLTVLNGAMENGHCPFPDGLVSRHQDFVMVGTGNTCGRGANPSYPERRPFDSAFADRFTYIEWNYDEKLERKIALAINENCEAWVEWVQDVRKWASKNNPRFVPSPRATFRIARFLKDGQAKQEEILDGAMWRGDDELRKKVLMNCPLPA
jgi:cobaltochelatase CobS